MGGLNTQTQLETTGNPAMDAAKEQQTYDQLKAQGMSGAADESLEKYIRGGKSLVKEMMAKASSIPGSQSSHIVSIVEVIGSYKE